MGCALCRHQCRHRPAGGVLDAWSSYGHERLCANWVRRPNSGAASSPALGAAVTEPAPIMLVGLRPGLAVLTRRVVHVVPVPSTDSIPERLTAFCGLVIERGQADLLDGVTGAPCTMCTLQAPLPRPRGRLPTT